MIGYIYAYMPYWGDSSQTWMQDAELQDFTAQVIQNMRGVMEKMPPESPKIPADYKQDLPMSTMNVYHSLPSGYVKHSY